ncbi:MAG: DUF1552 domain-containing protein [Armatimonadota bacterium]
MTTAQDRRAFLRDLGIGAAALPFLGGLPSLAAAPARRKQRLVVIFTPDGVVQKNFWPTTVGADYAMPAILKPFEPFRSRLSVLHGVSDRIRGDGDNHMRGIGCLLTGCELFPGNVQGGSDTPAGWASGLSIDQEIRSALQKDPATRTRFGSLEFGVLVPERADTWTRMCYTGPNQPLAPIDDPYRMFTKLYGKRKDRETLGSILDDVREDLGKVRARVSAEDRRLLDEHAALVRTMEKDLAEALKSDDGHAVPELEPGVRRDNDNMPRILRQQIDLMVQAFRADATRIASLQVTNSVGQARMRWLGIHEGQHDLSHEPNSNADAQDKLTRINRWYAEQIAYLAQCLADTPEPGGDGSMLDHTLIVWTNELGEGNSHTLENIPWVLLGGAPGFAMGRSLKMGRVPHNRLLLSIAHAFGHRITRFGNPDYCGDGPLNLG